jgi:hypothetical protein
MSSGNFGKNLAKIRAFVTRIKISYAFKVGKAPKSERPPGEEIRRALLISIGSLGGGGAANPVRGTLGGGVRRPIDARLVAVAAGTRQRPIGMAPMRRPHMWGRECQADEKYRDWRLIGVWEKQ